MIVLKNVTKMYGDTVVLNDVSFQINPAEMICITGKSGAGKSSLLHLLTGAEHISNGSIEVDGVDLSTVPPPIMQLYRRRLGVVFQDYKLLKRLTVAENIAFPLEVCGIPRDQIAKRVNDVLKQMELTQHRDTLPHALSGGEKARTAIGRAIIHQPMIVLADEPTGNIDPDQSKQVLELFQAIHNSGTTVVIATHDSGLVDTLQARVIRLEDGTITRDSHGGYDSETTKKSKKTSGDHRIFEQTSPKKSRRKVKVTAVGS